MRHALLITVRIAQRHPLSRIKSLSDAYAYRRAAVMSYNDVVNIYRNSSTAYYQFIIAPPASLFIAFQQHIVSIALSSTLTNSITNELHCILPLCFDALTHRRMSNDVITKAPL